MCSARATRRSLPLSSPPSPPQKWPLILPQARISRKKPPADAHIASLSQRYGSAYLITSISLSLVSFGLCYAAVSAGVDVAALLGQVRMQSWVGGREDSPGSGTRAFSEGGAIHLDDENAVYYSTAWSCRLSCYLDNWTYLLLQPP